MEGKKKMVLPKNRKYRSHQKEAALEKTKTKKKIEKKERSSSVCESILSERSKGKKYKLYNNIQNCMNIYLGMNRMAQEHLENIF